MGRHSDPSARRSRSSRSAEGSAPYARQDEKDDAPESGDEGLPPPQASPRMRERDSVLDTHSDAAQIAASGPLSSPSVPGATSLDGAGAPAAPVVPSAANALDPRSDEQFNRYSTAREPVIGRHDAPLVRRWSRRLRAPFRRRSSLRRTIGALVRRESAPASPRARDTDAVVRGASLDRTASGGRRRRAAKRNAALEALLDADGLRGRSDYSVLADPRLFSGLFAGAHAAAPLPDRSDAAHAAVQSDPLVLRNRALHTRRASASETHLRTSPPLVVLVGGSVADRDRGLAVDGRVKGDSAIQSPGAVVSDSAAISVDQSGVPRDSRPSDALGSETMHAAEQRHRDALRRFNSLLVFEREASRTEASWPTEEASARAVLRHVPRAGARATHHPGLLSLTDAAAVFRPDSGARPLSFGVPWAHVVAVRRAAWSGIVLHTTRVPVVFVEVPDADAVATRAEAILRRTRAHAVAEKRGAYMAHARRIAQSSLGGGPSASSVCLCGGDHASIVADVSIDNVPPVAVLSRLLGEGRVPHMGRGAFYAALCAGAAVIGDTGWRAAVRHVRASSLTFAGGSGPLGVHSEPGVARHKRATSLFDAGLTSLYSKQTQSPTTGGGLPAETVPGRGAPQRAVWVNVPRDGGETLRLEIRLRQTHASPDRCVVDGVLRIRPGVAAGVSAASRRGAVALRWSARRETPDGPTRLRVSVQAFELDSRLPGGGASSSALLVGLARTAVAASHHASPHLEGASRAPPAPEPEWTWRTALRVFLVFGVQPFLAELACAPRAAFAAGLAILLAAALYCVLCHAGVLCAAGRTAPAIAGLGDALRLDSPDALHAALVRLIADRQQ